MYSQDKKYRLPSELSETLRWRKVTKNNKQHYRLKVLVERSQINLRTSPSFLKKKQCVLLSWKSHKVDHLFCPGCTFRFKENGR